MIPSNGFVTAVIFGVDTSRLPFFQGSSLSTLRSHGGGHWVTLVLEERSCRAFGAAKRRRWPRKSLSNLRKRADKRRYSIPCLRKSELCPGHSLPQTALSALVATGPDGVEHSAEAPHKRRRFFVCACVCMRAWASVERIRTQGFADIVVAFHCRVTSHTRRQPVLILYILEYVVY